MSTRQKPRQIAKRLNAIGPRRTKKETDKIEGLARSIALRIWNREPAPPGYANKKNKKDWSFVIMQFYRPVNQAVNKLKDKLAELGK